MSHPFGDLLSQHLHRKHGLSQSKLAAGILQEPAIITRMCKGERLTGPQSRERVVSIVGWLHAQAALETPAEANALLMAAGLAPLHEIDPAEATLLHKLNVELPHASRPHMSAPISPPIRPIRRIHLPAATTPFVGRKDDLATIDRHLSDPRCRMLTLVGPGGVGNFGIVTRYWFRSPGVSGTNPAVLLPKAPASVLRFKAVWKWDDFDEANFLHFLQNHGRWCEQHSVADSPFAELYSTLFVGTRAACKIELTGVLTAGDASERLLSEHLAAINENVNVTLTH